MLSAKRLFFWKTSMRVRARTHTHPGTYTAAGRAAENSSIL